MTIEGNLSPGEYLRWLKDRRVEIARREVRIKPEDRDGLKAVLVELKRLRTEFPEKSDDGQQTMVAEALPLLIDLLRGSHLFPEGMPSLSMQRHKPGEYRGPGEIIEIVDAALNRQEFASLVMPPPPSKPALPEVPPEAPPKRSFWSRLFGRQEG